MKYETKKFKDGQISSKITGIDHLFIEIKGNSYEELFKAASIKEAWDSCNSLSKNLTSSLYITCLIGQRSDRRFNHDESFDLKVIANFINSMNFDKVMILHSHSSVSLALINNSSAIDYFEYVERAFNSINDAILVSPDAGAYKSTYEIAEKLGAEFIASNKVRIEGLPKISIQGDVKGRNCLIVDDLADGGRTFKYLSESLKEQGAKKVYLYVTHGMFNFGFDELKESIDGIYCTNSFRDIDNEFVTQYKVI